MFALLLSLLLIAGMCGCHNQKDGSDTAKKESTGEKAADTSKNENVVKLYYLNAKGDGFEKVDYTLENTDPLKASYEVIYKLSDTENSNTDQYKASVFDGIMINKITVDDGKENIDFSAGYNQLNYIQEALLRTSIVKTVLQISGIKSVVFSVNGSSLLGGDKVPVGVMDDESILTNENKKDIYQCKKKVKLYYTNQKGNKLIPYEKTLTVKDNTPLETQVLMELKKAPASKKNLKSPLPDDFQVNESQVLNNICYIDLSSDIENAAVDVKGKIAVYAMVNSLTELDTAYQVQFTVDGSKVDKLGEFEGFGKLLTSDYSLCK